MLKKGKTLDEKKKLKKLRITFRGKGKLPNTFKGNIFLMKNLNVDDQDNGTQERILTF